jgi:hypothetical protein
MEEIPMKRIAFAAAAAALLGTGCISHTTTTNVTPPSTGAVNFGWSFIRWIADTNTTVPYTCQQAGIDNVIVSFSVGGDVQVPCADASGDGALINGVAAGTQTVVVTGLRGCAALYSAQTTVTVGVGQTTSAPVQVSGIPNDLAVYAHFRGQSGANTGWATCFDAGVTSLDYTIVDWANTVVASGTVSCTDPAGVSFLGNGGLDRDNYAIRMRGFNPSFTAPTFDSASPASSPACNGQAFNHFGNDAWDVVLYDVTSGTSCM